MVHSTIVRGLTNPVFEKHIFVDDAARDINGVGEGTHIHPHTQIHTYIHTHTHRYAHIHTLHIHTYIQANRDRDLGHRI